MATRVVVGPFEYVRRDYTPRKGQKPQHDWVRTYQGHRAIVGAEVRTLVDEIARLQDGITFLHRG